jgi:hypothetical protein
MKLRLLVLLISCALLCDCKTGLIDRLTGENIANEIRATGSPATARVLKIWDAGIKLNGNPVVGFRLEIRADGIAPFVAETKALINYLDIPRIQPGTVLAVRYDPNDHKRVALDIYDDKK